MKNGDLGQPKLRESDAYQTAKAAEQAAAYGADRDPNYDSTRPVLGNPGSQPAPGYKHDGGKVPLHLLSTVALNKTAEVMAFGAKKYGTDAWRAGMDWSRLIGAALRHITAFNGGEDVDPESGLSHMAHAACCVMFLLEYEDTFPEGDDRYDSFKAQVERLKQAVQVESPTYRGASAQYLRLLGHPGESIEDTYRRLYYPMEVKTDGEDQDKNKAVSTYPDVQV